VVEEEKFFLQGFVMGLLYETFCIHSGPKVS